MKSKHQNITYEIAKNIVIMFKLRIQLFLIKGTLQVVRPKTN
jgi:hypothetical protein